MTEEKIGRVLDRMRGLCSRREYCSADIYGKSLALLDGDEKLASEVLASLVKDRYVDDLRYASAYARDKSAISGWGTVKIRHALVMKSIPRDVIAEALGEIDADKAQTRLEKLLENKLKSLKDDPQCRFKLLRFGLGRGYTYDEVESAVRRLMK